MRTPSKMSLVAIGANAGHGTRGNVAAVKTALSALGALGHVAKVSNFWKNPAWPPGSGPDFVNACALLDTPLAPEGVLSGLHRIEARMGRERGLRWGARVIDLDLLAQGEAVLPDRAGFEHWRSLAPQAQQERTPDHLILPHPRLQDRAFVLLPLAEIAPDWRHPVLGRSVLQMVAALDPGLRAGMVRLRAEHRR